MGIILNDSQNLKGQFLVAMPSLDGGPFEKAVIYVCAHDKTGAMGVAINRTMDNIKYEDLLDQLSIKSSNPWISSEIYFGGPVEPARGFILHTSEYKTTSTHIVESNIAITTTVDVIKDMEGGSGPQKSLIALGYSGWQPGQLEQEIKENSWLVVPAREDIIFNYENSLKWQESAKLLGINFANLSDLAGHA